jgi:hypothetical protein
MYTRCTLLSSRKIELIHNHEKILYFLPLGDRYKVKHVAVVAVYVFIISFCLTVISLFFMYDNTSLYSLLKLSICCLVSEDFKLLHYSHR